MGNATTKRTSLKVRSGDLMRHHGTVVMCTSVARNGEGYWFRTAASEAEFFVRRVDLTYPGWRRELWVGSHPKPPGFRFIETGRPHHYEVHWFAVSGPVRIGEMVPQHAYNAAKMLLRRQKYQRSYDFDHGGVYEMIPTGRNVRKDPAYQALLRRALPYIRELIRRQEVTVTQALKAVQPPSFWPDPLPAVPRSDDFPRHPKPPLGPIPQEIKDWAKSEGIPLDDQPLDDQP